MCFTRFDGRVNPLDRVKAADAARGALAFIPFLSPASYCPPVPRRADGRVVCRSHG
jgi:hypothetical protein